MSEGLGLGVLTGLGAATVGAAAVEGGGGAAACAQESGAAAGAGAAFTMCWTAPGWLESQTTSWGVSPLLEAIAGVATAAVAAVAAGLADVVGAAVFCGDGATAALPVEVGCDAFAMFATDTLAGPGAAA